MQLTDNDLSILNGDAGEAARLAMNITLEMGNIYGAPSLMDISMVHDDSVFYMGDAGIEFAEKLAALHGQVAVPTSLNACTVDNQRAEKLRTPLKLLEKYRRLDKAHMALGVAPTWTCAPYQSGFVPRFGQQIAWAESNATVYANSVIGARTNRYAGLMDLCAALTGRVPRSGYHLTENRKANLLITLENMPSDAFSDDSIWPLLGFVLGEAAEDKVAAMQGVSPLADTDHLKAFGAAAATSGAVALFHLIGITPEAPSLTAAFHGEKPGAAITVGPESLKRAEDRLNTLTGNSIDLVALGCPHFSYMEFTRLLVLLNGRSVASGTAFWVFTSRSVLQWLKDAGLAKALDHLGVTIWTDGCPASFPNENWGFQNAMTNSAKMASYCGSESHLNCGIGSLADCVETAVSGRMVRRRPPWA